MDPVTMTALASVASSALDSGGGGGGIGGILGTSSEPFMSTPENIHVAPIGVNFGAIMQPYTQGSPENGGYGIDYMSRYIGQKRGNSSSVMPTEKAPLAANIPLVVAGGGLALLLFALR